MTWGPKLQPHAGAGCNYGRPGVSNASTPTPLSALLTAHLPSTFVPLTFSTIQYQRSPAQGTAQQQRAGYEAVSTVVKQHLRGRQLSCRVMGRDECAGLVQTDWEPRQQPPVQSGPGHRPSGRGDQPGKGRSRRRRGWSRALG